MGLYQAAWAIGGLYGGFILQAMGTDFYPRLTGVANDHQEVNRLVNEQMQVSILLAGPGVVATLAFAPLIMHFFYTAAFAAGTDLLRWICLGMMLRIISWPVGYIVVAKGAQRIFFWIEVAATAIHLGLAWTLVGRFGVVGAGGAFLGLYIWHAGLIYVVARRLTDFRCSAINLRLCVVFLMASGAVLAASWTFNGWMAMSLGAAIAVGSGVYSLKALARLVPMSKMPRPLRGLLTKFA